jgi:hypothetical protein
MCYKCYSSHLGRCKLQWFNIDKNYTPYKSIQDFFKWFKWTWLLLFKCYYFNFWIINVQSLIKLPKSMWKLVFNVVDIIFKFGDPRKKTHKVQRNNAPSKNFKKYACGLNIWKTNKNCNLYGLMKIWSNFNHSKVPNY